jgi:DNA-binding NtrC family response regulator
MDYQVARKILIIDDEIDICYLLSGLLRRHEFVPKYVTSISDASSVIARDRPSVILLDNHLADGLGIDFIDDIKSFHPAIKVVVITAYDDYEVKEKAFKAGADAFLSKPFSKDALIGVVLRLISP